MTPVEEVLDTLDVLVRAGKIRYVGCSNFSGWHLMKSLAAAERYGLPRYVAHQAYYSLVRRDYEWELMPLALDQVVGTVVRSLLGWGRLSGKVRRGQPLPETTRLHNKKSNDLGPQVPSEHVFRVVEHPTVGKVRETGRLQPASPAKLDAAWLRQLCLDCGADDVGLAEIDRPALDDQRDLSRQEDWAACCLE